MAKSSKREALVTRNGAVYRGESKGVNGQRPRVSSIGSKTRGWKGAALQFESTLEERAGDAHSESRELREPYRQESWVYACCRRTADALESADLSFFASEKDELKQDHPLVKLWRRPNPVDTSADLLWKLGTYLQLTGELFLFLTDGNGLPVRSRDPGVSGLIELPSAIWPVMGGTRNVQEVVDEATGKLVGWRVRQGASIVEFPAASVVLIRYPDPRRAYRGLGPLGAAYSLAVQNYFANRYQNNLLRNGGDPGGIITVPGFLRPEEREVLRSEIEEQFNDPENAGETKLLEGGITYQPTAFKPKDMAWQQLQQDNRLVMGAVFGVPPAVLGMNTENYATFRGQQRVFWSMTVVPILRRLARSLGEHLIARLTVESLRAVRCQPNLGEVEAIRGDTGEASQTAQRLWQMGVPLDDALEIAGITADDFPGGGVGLVQGGLVPLVEMAPEPTGEETADPTLALSGVQIDALLKIIEAVANGTMPKSTAAEVIVASFPLDRKRAEAILKDVEEGSRPNPDEQPEEPTPAPGEEPAPAAPADDGKAKADEPASLLATREGRVAVWKAIQAKLSPVEARCDRKVRSVFHRMRGAQLAHLRALADKGEPQPKRAPVYAGEPPTVSKAGLTTLRAAALLDRRSASDQVDVVDCLGEVLGREWTPGPNVRLWLASRPRLKGADPRRLVDVAHLAKASLTEADIDQLVAVLDQKWADEIAAILRDTYERAGKAADAQILSELGPAFVATPDPKAIRVLRDKAIKVAEGAQSTVARNLRSALIEVLAESNAVGTLQDKILAEFEALADSTRQQFNMNARRARTIARTEVGQASSVVRTERIEEAAKQGLVTTKTWITAVPKAAAPPYEEGGYVRFQHWSMDGETTGATSSWTMPDGTILAAPKAPGGPAAQIINCRCDEACEVNEQDLV